MQTKKLEQRVFPDCIRVLQRVRGTKEVVDKKTGQRERMFNVRVSERRSGKLTRKADLLEILLNLFDM